MLSASCAHSPDKPPGIEALKPAATTFHQRLRWGDYRGAAELIVEERRDPFLAARTASNDEKDLEITEYELEDARLAPDGLTATVLSKVSWMRLPSVTVEEKLMRTAFEWRAKSWFVVSVENGPFGEELAPETPRAP